MFRVEFTANVKASSASRKSCMLLSATVEILLEGNSNKIKISQIEVFDEENSEWKSGKFEEYVETTLSYAARFRTLKNRKAQFQTKHFHNGKIC